MTISEQARPDRSEPDAPQPCYTLSEAAAACGIHRSTIRRALDAGRLPGAFRAEPDGVWRVPASALAYNGWRPGGRRDEHPATYGSDVALRDLMRELSGLFDRLAAAERRAIRAELALEAARRRRWWRRARP